MAKQRKENIEMNVSTNTARNANDRKVTNQQRTGEKHKKAANVTNNWRLIPCDCSIPWNAGDRLFEYVCCLCVVATVE